MGENVERSKRSGAASTGPRLVGRGNGSDAIGKVPTKPSFNGAAPCGARKCARRTIPRPFPPWLQRGRALWGAEIASRPGKRHSGNCSLQRGRALWGAEMQRTGCHRPEGRRSFNGAAPCGARKSANFSRSAINSARLQRGRALWGAEIYEKSNNSWYSLSALQRGRALWGAEIWCVSAHGRSNGGPLQRGRALWGAEIRPTCPTPFCSGVPASTGPRLVGRGNRHRRDFGNRGGWASTGPRLVGRGNEGNTNACLTINGKLQRGRALWGAEMSPATASQPGGSTLQRGRALWGAEMRRGRMRFSGFRFASTGPRLVGRGNSTAEVT